METFGWIFIGYLMAGMATLPAAFFFDVDESLGTIVEGMFSTLMIIIILWPIFWIVIVVQHRKRRYSNANAPTFGGAMREIYSFEQNEPQKCETRKNGDRVLKHYLVELSPGFFFAEDSTSEIPSREVPIWVLKKDTYAYYVYDKEEQIINGETLSGSPKNRSGHVFVGGEILTLEDIPNTSDNWILRSNMESNGYAHVVRTKFGQTFPLRDGDTVIRDTR